MAPRDRPPHRRHRQVAQRQRRGVGGVGGLRQRTEPEASLDHPLHLLLGRRTPAGDGVLDLVRRVLHDVAAGVGGLGQGEPAGLADAHRRAHVDLEEHLLDGDDVGRELGDQRGRTPRAASPDATAGPRCTGVRITPEGDGDAGCRPVAVDHGVAAAGQAGVDAEHPVAVLSEHRFAL